MLPVYDFKTVWVYANNDVFSISTFQGNLPHPYYSEIELFSLRFDLALIPSQ